MRTTAEIVQAMNDTGYYNGPTHVYSGDGFSIPYQIAIPISLPTGLSLAAYKWYLDHLCPEAARRHDFLYTPYGKLISITREEADQVIKDTLAEVSVIDSLIVYAAVREFGAPYFGDSMTGFERLPIDSSSDNPAPTGASGHNRSVVGADAAIGSKVFHGSKGDHMSIDGKAILIFQQTSGPENSSPPLNYGSIQRTGGWTESVLFRGDSMADLVEKLKGPRQDGFPALLPSRAAVLNNAASIVGVRLYQIGVGKGQFTPAGYPGSGGVEDIPQLSLLCSYTDPDSGKVRRWQIRGVPGSQQKNGEFNVSAAYQSAMLQYFDSLTNFRFVYKTKSNPTEIFHIDDNGLVTFRANSTFAIGNKITVMNAVNLLTGGRIVTKEYRISGLPAQDKCQLEAWTNVGGALGGSAFIAGVASTSIKGNPNCAVERMSVRKVGAPFYRYRARRSKRKIVR